MIAAAKTGIASINNIEVKKIDQTNKLRVLKYIPSNLKLTIVEIKFIEARIDEVPTRWKLNIK